MGHNRTAILKYQKLPDSITELVKYKDVITKFKNKNFKLIDNFFDDKTSFTYMKNGNEVTDKYKRFLPKHDSKKERRNVGVFSTAVCLNVAVEYEKEFKRSGRENYYLTCSSCDIFFKFLVLGLTAQFVDKKDTNLKIVEPGLLSKINSLNNFHSYFKKKEEDINTACKEEKLILEKMLIDIVCEFEDIFDSNPEIMHPYISYKFLVFLYKWEKHIHDAIERVKLSNNYKDFDETKKNKLMALCSLDLSEKNQNNSYKKYFFNKIYLYAKYELYRQMALKLSGDTTLYDVKRLIYSLLIVYIDNRFSNNLVRERALELIFETQRKEPYSIWPTGQLLPISVDSLDSISSVECASDLLDVSQHNELYQSVCKYLPEMNTFFHSVMRVLQLDHEKNIKGWYPLNQRDKAPTSWISGLALLFIKRFCKLLALVISTKAQDFFQINYRSTHVSWERLFDSTAVKSKLRLMFKEEQHDGKWTITPTRRRTAMFFGPPGTGKTTLARALATRLGWKYLELTPGDFYSRGEHEILPRINDIFNNLRHLPETVVFIDEIDDLVVSRDREKFDPRTLYANTLLPRFQELHDESNIILITSTNHIGRVDGAIRRLGRFDLIMPVGGLSIHGRLDLLFRKFAKNELIEELRNNNHALKYGLIINFLKYTSYLTYSDVNYIVSYCSDNKCFDKSILSKIEKTFNTDKYTFSIEKNNYLKQVKNGEIKPDEEFVQIRPLRKNDFADIEAGNSSESNDACADLFDGKSKNSFIKTIIRLFVSVYELKDSILQNNFDDVEHKVDDVKIILDVLLDKKKFSHDEFHYSIITPFYDDLKFLSFDHNPYTSSLQNHYESLKEIIDRS